MMKIMRLVLKSMEVIFDGDLTTWRTRGSFHTIEEVYKF